MNNQPYLSIEPVVRPIGEIERELLLLLVGRVGDDGHLVDHLDDELRVTVLFTAVEGTHPDRTERY